MLRLDLSTQFKKDLKKVIKQGKNKSYLDNVIKILQNGDKLPKEFRDHDLIGNWKGYRECHINSDWLLIYKICNGDVRLLRLARTGSHSDLFKK